jgi:hypothetical protein
MAGEGDEEEIVPGTESEGTAGQSPESGDDESEVSAEHTDEEADDGESEVAAEPPQKGGSRGEGRIQRLANEAKAAREEAAAARREAQEARREAAQRQEQQTEAQQREMLALMTPEERAEWRIGQMERRQAQERQQDRTQIAMMMDKTSYDAKAAISPVFAKYKDVVEELFQKQLALGRPVEREVLLQNHLGKLAIDGAGKSGQARRQAGKRVESQRVSAGSGKGDAPSSRGKAGDTAENRLKGVII